jgi:hypothetical protein
LYLGFCLQRLVERELIVAEFDIVDFDMFWRKILVTKKDKVSVCSLQNSDIESPYQDRLPVHLRRLLASQHNCLEKDLYALHCPLAGFRIRVLCRLILRISCHNLDSIYNRPAGARGTLVCRVLASLTLPISIENIFQSL